MIAQDIVSDILLGLAVLVVASASVGVLVMRDAYQKLHFVTPAALVAPALVALAVFVQVGVYENTGETFLALLFMVIAGPFLSHATIRAIRVREQGRLAPRPGEWAEGSRRGRRSNDPGRQHPVHRPDRVHGRAADHDPGPGGGGRHRRRADPPGRSTRSSC